jgi:hypothetical protein
MATGLGFLGPKHLPTTRNNLTAAQAELILREEANVISKNVRGAGYLRIAATLAVGLVILPTMIVSFARYSRDRSFGVLAASKMFVIVMAADSRPSLPMVAII